MQSSFTAHLLAPAQQRSTVCGEQAIGLPGSVIAVVGPDILLVDRQSGAAKYRQAHTEDAAVRSQRSSGASAIHSSSSPASAARR